jgi:hypothetical protein
LHQSGQFPNRPVHGAEQYNPEEEQIGGHGGPDLDQDAVLQVGVKGFDFQILLDPAEKGLDL